ncbi:hypothetical protein [Polynucleobacter sp. IMCC 30228]|uniref:hypothetical protein n=1 Tax=Polynucleobacter sp. IMCC 30228 TaxID=2781011 RepID=UPI001F3E4DE8|nr:hypothetical protein [Polynucleobacter sp. IMCC 30228]MCE7527860.1 hypothetical protein [Polynucleobacter sp. IMCC 30228]
MDANETYSVYWHSYNLLHFDLLKSFGLTDEAYGFSSAAHPYMHTHQGNMPRLFGALIYFLGATSIEAQVLITTFFIGTLSLIFSYLSLRRIANPLFSFIFSALLFTDYLQIGQWQVVTYRVWYGFLFFGILACITNLDSKYPIKWLAGSYGLFFLMFYNELVFAVMIATFAILFTAYWHRLNISLILKIWLAQALGAFSALALLFSQLILKFGLSVVKQDFSTTFNMRNFGNKEDWANSSMTFFSTNKIVYWTNHTDSSPLRNLFSFIHAQTMYVFQIYTPWLTLIVITILSGYLFSLICNSDKFSKFNLKIKYLFTPAVSFSKILLFLFTLVTIVFSLTYIKLFSSFELIDAVFSSLIGLIFMGIIYANLTNVDYLKIKSKSEYSKWNSFKPILLILTTSFLIFIIFYGPSQFVSTFQLLVFISTCLIILLLNLNKIKWLGNIKLSYLINFILLFIVIFLIFFTQRIFGLKILANYINQLKSGVYYIVFLSIFLAALIFLITELYKDKIINKLGLIKLSLTLRKTLGNHLFTQTTYLSFIILILLFHWRLYDQDYSTVWMRPFNFFGGELLARLLSIFSIVFGCLFISMSPYQFLSKKIITHLTNVFILFFIGEIAFFIVFLLSPGYVISGYLQRTAPFSVFFTSIPLTIAIYLLFAVGLNLKTKVFYDFEFYEISKQKKYVGFTGIRNQYVATLFLSSGISLALILYWAALQFSYATALPPNYFPFLKQLQKPPFLGKSAIVMTYAAPVAAMTGSWAYFDPSSHSHKTTKTENGYETERDMKNFLWLADGNINLDYKYPDYFICMWPQSLRNIVADRMKGFEPFDNVCPRMPIVIEAQNKSSAMKHELIDFDLSPRGSWAIVKLDHELPPLVKDIKAKVIRKNDGFYILPEYIYIQQQGTAEQDSLVEIISLNNLESNSRDQNAKVIAKGYGKKLIKIPSSFKGIIALRITPISIKKEGESTTSSKLYISE